MTALHFIIGFVALQRIGEVLLAKYNTRRLKAEGAVEVGAKHYPLFLLLHGSWLLAILVYTPESVAVNYPLLGIFLMLQVGRFWVISTLGRYWTTRIITLPSTPLIDKGPYRFVRHPNYLIVMAEIVVLPMVFGNWQIALIWSLANGALLYWRIGVENDALKPRQRKPLSN